MLRKKKYEDYYRFTYLLVVIFLFSNFQSMENEWGTEIKMKNESEDESFKILSRLIFRNG